MNHTVSLILHHKILSVHRITAIWVFFIMVSFIMSIFLDTHTHLGVSYWSPPGCQARIANTDSVV